LSGYIFATKARIDSGKKPVKQQYLPLPYNMVNFGPLAAEIGLEVALPPNRAPPIFRRVAITLGIDAHV